MSPSQTTASGDWARARSTARSKDSSKSFSRWLTPSGAVTDRYDRPRWASPRAATFMTPPRAGGGLAPRASVDQGGHVGAGDGSGLGRLGRGPHQLVVEVDLGRHREGRLEVGDQALAGHQRLDL